MNADYFDNRLSSPPSPERMKKRVKLESAHHFRSPECLTNKGTTLQPEIDEPSSSEVRSRNSNMSQRKCHKSVRVSGKGELKNAVKNIGSHTIEPKM